MNLLKINNQKFEVETSTITGKDILELAGLTPPEDFELLYKINEKGFEPIQLDEVIDLKSPGIEGFTAKPYKSLIILVDDEPVEVEECFMTPIEILDAVSKTPSGFYLKQIKGNIEIGYKNDPNHKVALKNKSRFTTCKLAPTTVS